MPGDVRNSYEHTNQARQILNDAEDDLKDWQPELEDVPSTAHLNANLMPSSRRPVDDSTTGGSMMGDENLHIGGENSVDAVEGSRISSGQAYAPSSVATGTAGDEYTPSEAGTTQHVIA